MAKRKKMSGADIIKRFDAEQWQQTYLKTGIIPIDLVTRGNGLPLGRFVQFWSPSGFGKSTALFAACRSLSLKGVKSWYAAIEPGKKLAEDMGLFNPGVRENFELLDIQTYEELEMVTEGFLESDAQVLIIDSITAVTPSKQALGESSIEDATVGLDARIRSVYLKVFGGLLKRTDKVIVYITQARANFDAGWGGDDFKAEGGFATKFYADTIFSMKGDARVTGKDTGAGSKAAIGKKGYLWAEKNRHASPYARIPIQIIFGKGVSNIFSYEQYLRWKGCITAGGSSFKVSFNDTEVSVRGRIGLNEWIKENQSNIKKDMYEHMDDYYKALLEGVKYT